jgi:hypothetical protein
MKLFTTLMMSAGLAVAATAANAQVLYGSVNSHYAVVSDVGGPYAAMPEPAPVPGYGPTLLPAPEVYTVLRESGFSPLGIPRLRGQVYTIGVVNRRGEDGRLVIDARDGRIIRFVPGYRIGDLNDDPTVIYGPGGVAPGPAAGPVPPRGHVGAAPRPPLSIPRVASRTPSVPMSKTQPPQAAEPTTPLAAKPAPEPAQRSLATQTKPADAQASVPAAVETKPAPEIKPTQEMPRVQGLD